MEAAVTALFDEATNTVSYIVSDPATAKPAIVDCVLDFNPKSARTSTCSADRLIEAVRRQDLEVEWILETHVHADHLSAAPVHQGEARSSILWRPSERWRSGWDGEFEPPLLHGRVCCEPDCRRPDVKHHRTWLEPRYGKIRSSGAIEAKL